MGFQSLQGDDSTIPSPSGEGDLNRLVQRVASMARASIEAPTDLSRGPVQLSLDLMSGPLVTRTTPEFVAALVYAIENAAEAMPGGGEIRVRTDRDNGHALILVQDNGTGAPALEDAFAPMVSTTGKLQRGLRLSLLRSVVVEHGGTATLIPRAEGGTILEIRLPLASENAESTREKQ